MSSDWKFKTRPKYTISMSLVLAFVVALAGSSCKDLDEYDPNEPLDPPPAPPNLIFPLPDTNLCDGVVQHVFFDWNTLSGAEIYELQIDSSLSFTTSDLYQIEQPPTYIDLYRYAERATYYAIIRAASSRWNNYTNWSQPRRFYLRPEP